MNKKVLVSLVSMMSVALAAVGVSRLIQYYTSLPEADPVYERVEAQRYEIVFPKTVNSLYTFGNLRWSTMGLEDSRLFGSNEFFDEDCLDGDDFYLAFQMYCDGSEMIQATLLHEVVQGEYGRYLISETQEADEPVAFTLEPIYEYVLV